MSKDAEQSPHGVDPFAFDESVVHVRTPLWRECQWPLDWWRLRTSAVYCGRDVPSGDGEPVLVIPGFLTGDPVMFEMHRWLRRIGYRSHSSRIIWNTDCPDRTARELATRTQSIAKKSGQRVRIIGHSLGGMLAKSLVQAIPEHIDRIVTLGSPFRDLVRAHPAVVGLWDKLKFGRSAVVGRNLRPSCATGHCLCPFVRHMLDPDPRQVPQFAVYSKNDGVVDWRSCIDDDDSRNSEVSCTHIGMAADAGTYRAIANRLAESTS